MLAGARSRRARPRVLTTRSKPQCARRCSAHELSPRADPSSPALALLGGGVSALAVGLPSSALSCRPGRSSIWTRRSSLTSSASARRACGVCDLSRALLRHALVLQRFVMLSVLDARSLLARPARPGAHALRTVSGSGCTAGRSRSACAGRRPRRDGLAGSAALGLRAVTAPTRGLRAPACARGRP